MKAKKVSIIDLVQKELEKAKVNDTIEGIYNFFKSVSVLLLFTSELLPELFRLEFLS